MKMVVRVVGLFHCGFEFMAILFASVVWGDRWRGQCIQFWCDNATVVCALTKYSCRDKLVMHLLRGLIFVAAHISFTWHAVHNPG